MKNKFYWGGLLALIIAAGAGTIFFMNYQSDKEEAEKLNYQEVALDISSFNLDGEHDKSIELLNTYIESSDNQENKCNALGLLMSSYAQKGNNEKPLEIFHERLEPNCEVGHILYHDIATRYKNDGNTELAKEYLEKAIDALAESGEPFADEYRKEYEKELNEIS